jgi:hypothetical protein
MLVPHLGPLAVQVHERAVHERASSALALPRRRASGRAVKSDKLPAWQQPAIVLAIVGATCAMSLVGLGAVARYFYMLAAFVVCGFYIKRHPWHYLTMTFWLWTVTPFARRFIDFHAGYDPASLMLGTPNFVAIFMFKSIFTSRDLLRQRESAVGLFLLVPLLWGMSVSLVSGEIFPALASGADWIGPLFYYYFFLANWRRIAEAEAPFLEFVTLNTVVMAGYALLQFISPQPWDVSWVINSGMVVIGHPVAYEIRVFGTLNSPGHLALWLSTLLLLALHFRTKLTPIAIPLAAIVLMLTLVRSAAGSVVLGLIVAAFMGRQGIFKVFGMVVLAGVLSVAGLSVFNPEVTDRLAARFDTVSDLGNDTSARAREEIYASGPALMDAVPFGTGIGGVGRGAVAQSTTPIIIDAGPLEVFVALGWVGGAVYLIGFFVLMIQAVMAARASRSSAALALAVSVVAGSSILVFSNIGGFVAATLWTCAAYAATLGLAAREQTKMLRVRRVG